MGTTPRSGNGKVRVSALGDISFAGKSFDGTNGDVFREVRPYWHSSHLVIANLESVLFNGQVASSKKCLLKGNPRWAGILAEAGITTVSLSNNHIMDYGEPGLLETMQALDLAGISHFGAGRNLDESLAPLYLDVGKYRVALLGRSSVIVTSRCYAGDDSAGVAPFDPDQTSEAIQACRKEADFVLMAIHWGIEHYGLPTPAQRKDATALIEAGADVVLGHHPHVLQGSEFILKGYVAYSLGNFLFNDFTWLALDDDGKEQRKHVSLSEQNRKGCMLNLELQRGTLPQITFIPTRVESDGRIKLVRSRSRMQQFKRLNSFLQFPAYRKGWKLYSLVQEVRLRIAPRFFRNFTWSKLLKIRPRHLREMSNLVLRSKKIIGEKSTNPYE